MRKFRAEFDLGDRMRLWYRSARKWKVATVRAWSFPRSGRSGAPDDYQVRCDGKDNPRYARAQAPQPLK